MTGKTQYHSHMTNGAPAKSSNRNPRDEYLYTGHIATLVLNVQSKCQVNGQPYEGTERRVSS